jgi:hypothetical protein
MSGKFRLGQGVQAALTAAHPVYLPIPVSRVQRPSADGAAGPRMQALKIHLAPRFSLHPIPPQKKLKKSQIGS